MVLRGARASQFPARDRSRGPGYAFPALVAKNFAEDLMPYFSIPRTWIIRNGEIAEEAGGFAGDGDAWVERVAARVKD